MKKTVLLFVGTSFLLSVLNAQVITDTVSLGTGYENQVWYSLENDEQGSNPKSNWDLAFDASSFGSAIHLNASTGCQLWRYPGDSSDFATLDTTGISNWEELHNTDTSWAYGAFSLHQSGLDVGWGNYNTVTHVITGDSLFVIKLASGTYQKLWIQRLSGGVYTFRHATLDNAMDMIHQLDKSNYIDKNFGYYSLQLHNAIDREPFSENWDLLFTQYTAFLPTAYTVAGVLQNDGVTVAKAYPVDDPSLYKDHFKHSFHTEINGIGYDWKSFVGSWEIADSLVYFVQTADGAIWKMVFTDFGGSSNGHFVFTKEKLLVSGITTPATSNLLEVYPNPSTGLVNLTYSNTSNQAVDLHVLNLSGQQLKEKQLKGSGFCLYQMDLSDLTPGVYLLRLQTGSIATHRKLIIH
jgi:hypothetical protein